MSPKYQIFISSTYEDLKDEREQIIQTIWRSGNIPVGMEAFHAETVDQWEVIKRTIDQCDYYIIITAHRYGSIIPKRKISYTEREYDYAISQNIPVLGFVLKSDASWNPKFIETDTTKKTALNKFIEKVKKKPCEFWSNKEDLSLRISQALSNQYNLNPRPGWVRADSLAGPEVSEEIARLSKENSELRKKVVSLEHQIKDIPVFDEEILNNTDYYPIEISALTKFNDPNSNEETKILEISTKDIFLSIFKPISKGSPGGNFTYAIVALIEEKLGCKKDFSYVNILNNLFRKSNFIFTENEYQKILIYLKNINLILLPDFHHIKVTEKALNTLALLNEPDTQK